MLDKRAYRILEIMLSMVHEGESVVIEKSDLMVEYGEVIDTKELDTIVELLALNDMIEILYTDNSVYGISPKPKGILTYETLKNQHMEEEKKQEENIKQDAEIASTEKNPAEVAAGILEKREKKEVAVTAAPRVNYAKMGIITGISAFLGSLLAAVVAYLTMF